MSCNVRVLCVCFVPADGGLARARQRAARRRRVRRARRAQPGDGRARGREGRVPQGNVMEWNGNAAGGTQTVVAKDLFRKVVRVIMESNRIE